MPTKKKSIRSGPPSVPLVPGDDQEKEYEAFVQGLRVIGIALASCVCNLDREAYYELKDQANSFSHEYELTEAGKDYFDATGRFSVTVAESTGRTPALSVKCIFQTHFHGQEPILRQHAERFTNSELKLILVPYARQFVTSITSQMSIGPVILPLTRQITTSSPKGKDRR